MHKKREEFGGLRSRILLSPLKDLKKIEISPFELKDTIVALIYTNPWKTSNKINPSYCSKLVIFCGDMVILIFLICLFTYLHLIFYLSIYSCMDIVNK